MELNFENNSSIVKANSKNNINYERELWRKYLLYKIFIIPILWTLYGKNNINIYDNNCLNNPIIARCINIECRKTFYLRDKTFFDKYPRIYVSTLLYIIKLWISEKKNYEEILVKINEEMTDNPISKQLIIDILFTLRRYIAHYIKDMYIIKNISKVNKMERFPIDESLFTNINNSLLWVKDIINTSSKKLRLDLSFNRNTDILKKIVFKHVH